MKTPLPCGRKRPAESQIAAKSDWKKILNEFLNSKGLRSTGPRERVAEIALSEDSHFEIQELIKKVQSIHPEISPATVYRSVDTLCEAGLLHESLQSHHGVKLYEPWSHIHHDHIVCLDCGEIFEFHDETLESAQQSVTKKMGFTEVKHQHVIYANCQLLKKK